MLRKIVFVLVFYMIFIAHSVFAVDFPALTGAIVDEARIFSASQYSYLSGQLKNAPHQTVVISLKDLQGMEIEDYVLQLVKHWGIEQHRLDDGIVIAIAPTQKRMHIAIGYGLKGIITDAQANQIIQNTMFPFARTGEYGEAAVRGTSQVLNMLYKAELNSIQRESQFEEVNNPFDEPVSSTELPSIIQEMLGWMGYLFWGIMGWSIIKRLLCKINSRLNKCLFVVDIIICQVISAFFIYFALKYELTIFAYAVGLFLLLAHYHFYRSWRQNPKFPCQPTT